MQLGQGCVQHLVPCTVSPLKLIEVHDIYMRLKKSQNPKNKFKEPILAIIAIIAALNLGPACNAPRCQHSSCAIWGVVTCAYKDISTYPCPRIRHGIVPLVHHCDYFPSPPVSSIIPRCSSALSYFNSNPRHVLLSSAPELLNMLHDFCCVPSCTQLGVCLQTLVQLSEMLQMGLDDLIILAMHCVCIVSLTVEKPLPPY